jgi:abnormal spindle-like microcephaly-associated protein
VVQVVLDFLHNRLQGEGDLLRHLELAGYRLDYQQHPLLEYPFTVSSLAVDLRDGLRVCRLAELLTGTKSLLHTDRLALALPGEM